MTRIAQPNNPSSTWGPVGTNATFNSGVRALEYDSVNNSLYAGGFFDTSVSPVSPGNRVAQIEQPNISTSTWAPVGTNATFNSGVFALAYDSGNNILYAGGLFSNPRNRVARIEQPNDPSSSWVSIGTNNISMRIVNAFAYDSGNNILYAGGETFTNQGRVTRIAQPNNPSSTWGSIGTNNISMTRVFALEYDSVNNILYAGGESSLNQGRVEKIGLDVRVTANSTLDGIYNIIQFNRKYAYIILNWKDNVWVILSQNNVTLQ